MGRLRWRKQPNERGLARVCQRERGADLVDGSPEVLAMVRPLTPDGLWYWYGSGVNTLRRDINRMFVTMEEAKADAMRTIKADRLAKMIESKLGKS